MPHGGLPPETVWSPTRCTGPPLARLRGEGEADVVQHRILHGDLQALALAGALLLVERARMLIAQQHAGAGIAERRARLDGRPSGSPVMLMMPPQACAIMSKARLFSNGLPSPKPFTWA